MAYYAELDGVSGLAQCASALSLPSDFEINYDLFILEDGNDDYFSAPFNGRGIGFLSSFIAFFESSQQVYFSYPSTGKPAINDVVNIRFTSTGNGDGTFTIRCYMSVNGGEEEQLSKVVGDDVFSQPLSPRPMEWGRRPNTLYRKVGVIRTRYYESGVIQNDWDFRQSSGSTAPDLVGSNPAALTGGFSWIYYDDGSSPEPVAQHVSLITAEIKNEALTLPISEALSVNLLTGEHVTNGYVLNLVSSQVGNATTSEERHQASMLTVEQTASQSVISIAAEHLSEAQILTSIQHQRLNSIVAQQVEQALSASLSSIQALTFVVAEERQNAAPLTVEQYTGQLITLIVAEQREGAQTLLVSQVNKLDLVTAEQTSDAQALSIKDLQKIKTIEVEQLTETEILHVLLSGDNTDLTGLRLQPVTPIYSITPIANSYSLNKV